jgi:chemotaxis methyl-accepting protein methylase
MVVGSRVLATDISLKALDIAKSGVYEDECLKKVRLSGSLRTSTDCRTGSWEVKKSLKDEVNIRSST